MIKPKETDGTDKVRYYVIENVKRVYFNERVQSLEMFPDSRIKFRVSKKYVYLVCSNNMKNTRIESILRRHVKPKCELALISI